MKLCWPTGHCSAARELGVSYLRSTSERRSPTPHGTINHTSAAIKVSFTALITYQISHHHGAINHFMKYTTSRSLHFHGTINHAQIEGMSLRMEWLTTILQLGFLFRALIRYGISHIHGTGNHTSFIIIIIIIIVCLDACWGSRQKPQGLAVPKYI